MLLDGLRRCAIDRAGRQRRTLAHARIGKRLPAMEMQDRAVIVTGGASGIGKATALLLARGGARVFVGDIDENGGQAVAAQAAGESLALEYLPLDLARTESIEAFVAAVHAKIGHAMA